MAETEIADSDGRKLSVRSLTTRERFDLFKAIPNEQQGNLSWMGWALSACSVRAIDGVPVPTPTTAEEIGELVAKLDEAGIEVAQQFIIRQQAERSEKAKNSQGTAVSASASGS